MNRLMLIGLLFWMGCQGSVSEKPPIHLNPNMDKMPRYKTQSESQFFTDGAAMRVKPEGTVALHDEGDGSYLEGIDANGQFVTRLPVELNAALLLRGQDRYNLYCSPCHGRTGEGNGIVVQRGFIPPPDFHTQTMRANPDGHFFTVISQGIRNMPTYRHQIPVHDRWAIVSYVRTLQRSRTATIHDVPTERR